MSELLQIRKFNKSTIDPLVLNQNKLLDKNRKPLMSHPPLVQTKLAINQPGDEYEQEADRIAEQVMKMPDPVLQRKCAKCYEDNEKSLQAKESLGQVAVVQGQDVPPIVHEVLQSPGKPLDLDIRTHFEAKFGHDFSKVRVHNDSKAAMSAHAANALAYTVGKDMVFGDMQYAPQTITGGKLLAHELTHVVQQKKEGFNDYAELRLDEIGDHYLRSANYKADNVEGSGPSRVLDIENGSKAFPTGVIRRQLITPLAPGGGFSGLMERDLAYRRRLMSTPFHVCSRALQIPVIGRFANHAYIEAPPNKYAVIGPLCKPTDGGPANVFTGAVASKWDNSPDPCGKEPRCVPCHPKQGVSDVGKCLRDAFNAYSHPSLYKILGPNSNTFAGTLARACCADMVPQPSELGIVPGWDDSPAPARTGDCPKKPSC